MSRLVFGVDNADDLTLFLARYLGLLVALIGLLIIHSAFHPEARTAILDAAIVAKTAAGSAGAASILLCGRYLPARPVAGGAIG